MNILFISVLPSCYTAYGKNCANICARLKERGHNVVIFAKTGFFQSQPIEWKGIPILSRKHVQSLDRREIIDAMKKYKIDVAMQHFDIWGWRTFFKTKLFEYSSYTPVDCTNNPPDIGLSEHLYEILKYAKLNFAMSEFAHKSYVKAGLPSHKAPHGYDPKVYFPVDKIKARKMLMPQLKDKFIFGTVSNNDTRKYLPNQIRAYKLFLENNPDAKKDTLYYMHTPFIMEQTETTGYNLPMIIKGFNLPKENIAFCHPSQMWNISEDAMRVLYNCFDCLLAVTMSEGFGLTILEAMASGIPTITTDFGPTKELSTGLLVKVVEWLAFNKVNAYLAVPSVEHMAEIMSRVYNSEQLRKKHSEAGLEKAKKYVWDKMVINIEEGLKKVIK